MDLVLPLVLLHHSADQILHVLCFLLQKTAAIAASLPGAQTTVSPILQKPVALVLTCGILLLVLLNTHKDHAVVIRLTSSKITPVVFRSVVAVIGIAISYVAI